MARQYGQDSEKGQYARAVKLQELEEESLFKQKIERYATIGLFVLGIVVLVGCILSSNNFKKMMAATTLELNQTQTDYDTFRAETEEEQPTVVNVEVVASSADEAGKRICSIQNDLNAVTASEMKESAQSLSPAHQALLQELRTYFAKGENTIIRGTWCTLGDWQFNGSYQYEGNRMTVVWKCYARDDTENERLLAFVKAKFNPAKEIEMFNDAEIYYTSWYKSAEDEAQLTVEGDQRYMDVGDGPPDELPAAEEPVYDEFGSSSEDADEVLYDEDGNPIQEDEVIDDTVESDQLGDT